MRHVEHPTSHWGSARTNDIDSPLCSTSVLISEAAEQSRKFPTVTGVALISAALLTGCGEPAPKSYDDLVAELASEKIGSDTDQWIEMSNIAGQWEKTGLIFGYVDDQGECAKAIDGLKRANPAREYRCSAAN